MLKRLKFVSGFFIYGILGILLATIWPIMGTQAPPVPKAVVKKGPKVENKDPKTDTAIPQKKGKADTSWIKNPQKTSAQEATEKKKAELDAELKRIPLIRTPPKLRPLPNKTTLLDARRLKDHKLTETIRYIKENPDKRFKLQNMTIDPDSVVSLMKSFDEAKVIDQMREIAFVMLPGSKTHQELNEKRFRQEILPYLGYLEGIELSCLGISNTVVDALLERLNHLKNISLFGVGITDTTITNLVQKLPNLVKIHLTNTSVTKKGIQDLAKNFPYLRSLGISGQHLKDSDFDALKEGVATLYSFSTVGQNFKDMKTVIQLLSWMPKLHTLDLSESTITDGVAKHIPQTVKSLDISETNITHEGIKDIVTRLDLTTLKMNHLKHIGKDELKFIIEHQPGLRKFYCAGVYLTDVMAMKLILELTHLTDVTFVPTGESQWMMSEAIAEALAHKKVRLQYLRIPANRLTEVLRLKLEKDIPNLRIEYMDDTS